MKTYKIKGVAKEICTVEQKLAYNIAFKCHINFGSKYEMCKTAIQKSEMLLEMRNMYMDEMAKNAKVKYNPDALFVALNQGLKNYMEHFFIANDYESIGTAFPIP